MRGTVVIDEDRCKGCELCTFVCPKQLLEMAETFSPRGYHPARLFDPRGDCTGCLLCAVICPDVAITVYRSIPDKRKTLHNQLSVTKEPVGEQNQAFAGIRETNVQPPRKMNERTLER